MAAAADLGESVQRSAAVFEVIRPVRRRLTA